jgi:hypothetical protein
MKLVPDTVINKMGRNALLLQKSSPGLLFGVGIVGVVGSTVLACRATLKMEEVLDEAKRKIDLAQSLEHDEYSEKDRHRDLSLIKFQSGVKIVKLYAPAIVVGGLSIAALTSSHNILTRRNAALTAAYAALDQGFREYRARVVDKYGEEEDRKLRYGTEKVQVVDPDTKKKKTIEIPGDPSVYARFFDEYSTSWDRDPEVNRFFLSSQQNYANDLLKSRGHVFLNEVYDMIGVPRSKAGAIVGWLLTDDGSTDNYINFGIFEGKTQIIRDFVNGLEGAILLDFNVDGVIYDQIDNLGEELQWQLGH